MQQPGLENCGNHHGFAAEDVNNGTKHAATNRMMDMLLGKKRAPDRKAWLENKGNLATV